MGGTPSTAFDKNNHEGYCSGDWTLGMISDEVNIPKGLKPGKCAELLQKSYSLQLCVCSHVYPLLADVLSWRWDCEETAQSEHEWLHFPLFCCCQKQTTPLPATPE